MKRLLLLLAACAVLLTLGACTSLDSLSAPFRRTPPRPGRTTLGSKLVLVPTKAIGNYLVVEAKWDRSGPYRFLIDTGSSVTLVTPAFAKRYASKEAPPSDAPRVRVLSADGQATELPPTTLRQLSLGDARFDDVFALIYDCTALSAHLGVKIDGILGFPLFRETLLTLDYPRARVLLQSPRHTALIPGSAIHSTTPAKPRSSPSVSATALSSRSSTPAATPPSASTPSASTPPSPPRPATAPPSAPSPATARKKSAVSPTRSASATTSSPAPSSNSPTNSPPSAAAS